MTQAAALQFDDSFDKDLPTSYMQQHWYAAYTCANHENRVASELQLRSVEHSCRSIIPCADGEIVASDWNYRSSQATFSCDLRYAIGCEFFKFQAWCGW